MLVENLEALLEVARVLGKNEGVGKRMNWGKAHVLELTAWSVGAVHCGLKLNALLTPILLPNVLLFLQLVDAMRK